MRSEEAARSPAPDRLRSTRRRAHPHCAVGSCAGPGGLGQEFMLPADGSVEGVFAAKAPLEGYLGLLHGGIAAAFLDGAMTNCLFAHGVQALTAQLSVALAAGLAVAVLIGQFESSGHDHEVSPAASRQRQQG